MNTLKDMFKKFFKNKFGQEQIFSPEQFGDGVKTALFYDDRDCNILVEQITHSNNSTAIFSEGFTGDEVELIDKAMQRAFYSNKKNFADSKVGNYILFHIDELESATDLACKYVDNYLALLLCSGAVCDALSREHYLPEENGGPNGGLVAIDLEERAGERHLTVVTLEDKRGENGHRFAILLESFQKGIEANRTLTRDDPCTKVKVETYFYCNKTNNFDLDDNRYLCDINGDFLKRVIKIS